MSSGVGISVSVEEGMAISACVCIVCGFLSGCGTDGNDNGSLRKSEGDGLVK